MSTKSQKVAADLSALFRARNPLIVVVTREEARAEQLIINAAARAGYQTKFWDVAAGVTTIDGKRVDKLADREQDELKDPGAVLDIVRAFATPKFKNDDPREAIVGSEAEAWNQLDPEEAKTQDRNVWIMRDLTGWLAGGAGMITCRQLRNLARQLPRAPRPVGVNPLAVKRLAGRGRGPRHGNRVAAARSHGNR